MFDLSPGKILVLVVAALFVLGPERLPAAAAWLGGAIGKAKKLAASANTQVRSELGPELDALRGPLGELRAPLAELRALRDPQAAVLRHLLTDEGAGPQGAGAGSQGAGAGPPSVNPATVGAAVAGGAPVIDHDAT